MGKRLKDIAEKEARRKEEETTEQKVQAKQEAI